MAARAGMGNLIGRVRLLANVGTSEWTLDATTYWTDDQIEDRLDLHRVDYEEQVSTIPVTVDSATEYHDYHLSYGNLEEAESGTTRWSVRSTSGTLQGTATYTPNYEAGLLVFTADTEGSAMLVRYGAYDVYAAAADIWRARAANVSLYYDIKEGEHSLSRSQMFKHCMTQAELMDSRSGVVGNATVRMMRSDLNC